LGPKETLWYEASDYDCFKQEAMREIREHMASFKIASFNKGMDSLYLPMNEK
jgi:hypothetical protein